MAADPQFLTLDEVLTLHSDQIQRYGALPGLRDVALLSSALGAPRATFGGEYLHNDLFEMAAAYLFHLVKNHAFLDGNKRVGLAAALLFLWMNDQEIDAEETELYELVLGVAEGRVVKEVAAEFLRQRAMR